MGNVSFRPMERVPYRGPSRFTVRDRTLECQGDVVTPNTDSGMRAVRTTLLVLEAVAEHQPVGVSALSRTLDTPKTSVQRCLVTLREAGWLAPDPADPRRWVLTGRAMAVGARGSGGTGSGGSGTGLREAALPTMLGLRDETGETVHLSGFRPEHAGAGPGPPGGGSGLLVVVDRIDSTEPVRTWVRLGTVAPLHASASGRAVLSRLPQPEAAALLEGPLRRYETGTLVDRGELAAELDRVCARGFAVADQSWRRGVGAVAAALVGPAGRPVGALAISVPMQRFDDARAAVLGPAVVAAADRVGTELRRARPFSGG